MAENNKQRDQRQDQGSKKEQKTSTASVNGKGQKSDSKNLDKKTEEKDSGRERRRK